MTFWDWYSIVGEVLVLEIICTRDFRRDAQATIIPEQINQGYSQRRIFFYATAACAVAAAIWPLLLVRSWFK